MTHFNHLISSSEILSPLSSNVSETDVDASMSDLLQSLPRTLNTGGTSKLAITTAFMSIEELYDAGAVVLHVLICVVALCTLAYVVAQTLALHAVTSLLHCACSLISIATLHTPIYDAALCFEPRCMQFRINSQHRRCSNNLQGS
jgi:hypothetical protein